MQTSASSVSFRVCPSLSLLVFDLSWPHCTPWSCVVPLDPFVMRACDKTVHADISRISLSLRTHSPSAVRMLCLTEHCYQHSPQGGTIRFKIVLLGEGRVGKTSLFLRYIHDSYNEKQTSTIRATYLEKSLTIGMQRVVLSIWDTAGQVRLRSLYWHSS